MSQLIVKKPGAIDPPVIKEIAPGVTAEVTRVWLPEPELSQLRELKRRMSVNGRPAPDSRVWYEKYQALARTVCEWSDNGSDLSKAVRLGYHDRVRVLKDTRPDRGDSGFAANEWTPW